MICSSYIRTFSPPDGDLSYIVIYIFSIRSKMSSTKDLNLGVDIEIHNGDQPQPHERIKRGVGRNGEERGQHHQDNGEKNAESPTSSSWWRKTTSLPSTLNRKKNILFQEKTKLNLVQRLIFFIQCCITTLLRVPW